MQKHLFTIIGKGQCGKTTVIKKINELYQSRLESAGFTVCNATNTTGKDIALRYTHPNGLKIGIFSSGDTASIIDKYCGIFKDCDIIICASRHTKPQFTAIRNAARDQNRLLHVLNKTGRHKTDTNPDDDWIIEQFKQKTQNLEPFSSL
ncbi:hypothetical protein [Candidatus Avelusimicrobium alvi]|uniref:hypothetical protein n=1 Tax=Candidatus Avelusimicrobium alvi TaxID=3416221 RepID=UPI003D0E413C